MLPVPDHQKRAATLGMPLGTNRPASSTGRSDDLNRAADSDEETTAKAQCRERLIAWRVALFRRTTAPRGPQCPIARYLPIVHSMSCTNRVDSVAPFRVLRRAQVEMGSFQHPSRYRRPSPLQSLQLRRIEDLGDAVRGAGLTATQLSSAPLQGSLVFAEQDGILCTSGLIGGRVGLAGPLSQDMITLGLGLRLVPGCWQWQTEVETGGVAIFNEAAEHDSLYGPGALYAAVQLSAERLEAEAATLDLVLDRKVLGGSRIHDRRLDEGRVRTMAAAFQRIHAGGAAEIGTISQLLSAMIEHLARSPVSLVGAPPSRHARIVQKARDFIHGHLSEPLSLDAIVAAAGTSRRTLNRAFGDILGDTPQAYVRRVRLHRVRQALADDAEAACTITLLANQWGISEVGRFAGRYKELFGELPSETQARSRRPLTIEA